MLREPSDPREQLVGRACHFKGSAVLTVRNRGQQVRARADVVWRGDSSFSVTVYGPLGNALAEIAGDSSGGVATVQGARWEFGFDDFVGLPGILDSNTFTFRQLVRILTGRLPVELDGEAVDSISRGGRGISFHFLLDGMAIAVQVNRRGLVGSFEVRSDSLSWVVTTKLEDGRAAEIVVRLGDGGDYFALRYDRYIFIGERDHCSRAVPFDT
jgi:hypothetical protein